MLRDTLRGIYRYLEMKRSVPLAQGRREQRMHGLSSEGPEYATGEELRPYAKNWDRIIVGEEGPKYFQEGNFWLVDAMTMAKLDEWMTQDNISHTLWISSPISTTGGMSSSRASALFVIASA